MEAKVAKTLMEAYASVYDQPEQIDEGITSVVKDPHDKAKGPSPTSKGSRIKMGPGEGKRFPEKKGPKGGYKLPERTPANAKNVEYYKDDADLFDIIKGHLMSEGLTEEEALQKMLTMTEEERQSIVEQAYTDPKYAERPQGVPYKDLKGFKPSAFKDMKQYPATLGGKKGMLSGDEGARGRSFREDPKDHDAAVKTIKSNTAKAKNRDASGRGSGAAAFRRNG